MRKLFSKFAFTAALMLAITFTFSCSSGDDNNGDGGGLFNENSQVYNEYYDDKNDVWQIGEAYKGSGVIKIRLYGEDGKSETLIDAGSVKNGIVNLQLPTTIPNNLLFNNFDSDACTVSPKDIKISDAGGFALIGNDGEYIGSLGIGYMDEKISERISYEYFSKAGKITCSFSGGKKKTNYDAKEGWNKIYVHRDEKTGIREYNTKNILTKEMKWTLTDE